MVFLDLLVVFSLLQLGPLSLATDKEFDLELRLAPPGTSRTAVEQSQIPHPPTTQFVQISNQMKTGKNGRTVKRKRGRPALELSVSVII